MYLWELVGHSTTEGTLLSGVDDDLAAVLRSGETLLSERRGFVVRVVEVVPRLSVLDLDVIYVPTGRQWLGRRNTSGGAHWEQSDRSVDPGTAYSLAPGEDLRVIAR